MATSPRELFPGHSVARTTSLDHARQVLSEVFLPLEFSAAQSTTALPMVLNVVKVAGVTLGYIKFQDVVDLTTAIGTNFHIVVPMSGTAVLRATARDPLRATTATAGVFVPGMQSRLELDAEYAQLSVVFPQGALEFELEAMLGRELGAPLDFAQAMDLEAPSSAPFAAALRLVDAVSQGDGAALANRLSAVRIQQVLAHSMLFAQPHNFSGLLLTETWSSGPRAVRVAVDRIHADPTHAWTVAELATASSVSVRSLQEGFRRTLETTPTHYLRRVRLERAHEALRSADPERSTVSEVASAWGFAHLGRFGQLYRRRFGESPSATLRGSGRPE